MKRRDHIKTIFAVTQPDEKLAVANSGGDKQGRAPAGPVKTMGLALGRIETESQALRDALAAGQSVIEIETDLIEPSFVRDRLPEVEGEFEAFQRSIAENGQEVPILVRPHPEHTGQFQIAFGHRRHRACQALGIKVKAVIREMDDRQLVVAQGIENAQRKDLSYIERALYAFRLEERGFERTVICDALATDKGELSKLISVARDVPEEIINAIGPAPKAGRRRWLGLTEALGAVGARKAALQAIQDPAMAQADTDARFLIVLAATVKPQPRTQPVTVWKQRDGKAAASLVRGKTVSIAFEAHVEPEFAEFVAEQLDELYDTFRARADGP